MVKVVNKSKMTLAIPGFKKFNASEVREVSDEAAEKLLANPFIGKAEVKPRKTSGKKEKEEAKKS